MLDNGDVVTEVDGPGAMTGRRHAFARHQVDPAQVTRAWLRGGAVVLDGVRGRPGEEDEGPVYTALGRPEDLEPLMAGVARLAARPARLRVERPAAVPPSWEWSDPHDWHWMLTGQVPPADERWQVEELDVEREAEAVDALLDVANPDSHARPGAPGVVTWLGVRDSDDRDRLLGVGALQRMHDGTLHLRGVAVRPDARGAGVGAALSAALTTRAVTRGSGVATLGVYTDNEVALRLYERLGYTVAHTFRSGVLAP